MGNSMYKLFHRKKSSDENKKKEYKLGKILGSGSFGVVRECVHRKTKEVYAVKIIKRKKKYRKHSYYEKMVRNEIKYLSLMNHSNIIRLKDFFEDHKKFYIVLEKCDGGELFYKIVNNRCLMENESVGIVRQICCALVYLHSKNIIHRDIKAENFLFKNKNTKTIKLIDFGMAKQITTDYLTEMCGSPHYISPELIKKKYTISSDIWALGVMVFFMLTGKYPFEGKSTPKVVDEILNKNINWKSKELSSLSQEAIDFLKKLLERNEKKRLTACQALNHPWVRSGDIS